MTTTLAINIDPLLLAAAFVAGYYAINQINNQHKNSAYYTAWKNIQKSIFKFSVDLISFTHELDLLPTKTSSFSAFQTPEDAYKLWEKNSLLVFDLWKKTAKSYNKFQKSYESNEIFYQSESETIKLIAVQMDGITKKYIKFITIDHRKITKTNIRNLLKIVPKQSDLIIRECKLVNTYLRRFRRSVQNKTFSSVLKTKIQIRK